MLIQDQSLLIGDVKDIYALAEKEAAKLLVVSDSHGEKRNLLDIIRREGKKCDAMIFCGDGMSDVVQIFEECKVTSELEECLPSVIGIVEGNNDYDSYSLKEKELTVPLFNCMEVCGHKIFFTHGHRSSLYIGCDLLAMAARNNDADIAVYGHTHVPDCNIMDDVLCINPGSVWNQRSSDPASYVILNVSKGKKQGLCIHFSAADGMPFKPESVLHR